MSHVHKMDTDDDGMERAPWEDGALTVDVTSVSAEVVLKNCLSDDLPLRLAYIKGLASAATRASKRELGKLLEVGPGRVSEREIVRQIGPSSTVIGCAVALASPRTPRRQALEPLLDDEALGVRLETLQQLQQLAKLAGQTVSREDVEEAVSDALEQQLRPSLDPGGPGGSTRQGGAGTGALPMVREALLASLDAVCGYLPGAKRSGLLLRLLRAVNNALDKQSASGGGGGIGGGGGGSKASGDAALMALSLAVVGVRHLDPGRGGLAMAAIAGRLCTHADLRVRELYGGYAAHPGALEQMFDTYEPLCSDKVWSVRQACARVVSELSRLCSCTDGDADEPQNNSNEKPKQQEQQQQRRQRADELQIRLLRRLFLDTLLATKSQWVVTAARQQAGAAVATLRRGTPTAELLAPLVESYCASASAVGQGAVEVRRRCAESFGDVVAKLVEADCCRWSELQPVMVRLLASNDGPTLCSLVASAERVVRLLAAAAAAAAPEVGREEEAEDKAQRQRLHDAARQVVSGLFLDVLRNQLYVVAGAASSALAGLLGVCPPELQMELLQLLPSLCKPPIAAEATARCGDWRPRLSLALQLHVAMRAVAQGGGGGSGGGDGASPEATALVAQCAVTLCGDPVWAVRQAAATQVVSTTSTTSTASTGGPTPEGIKEPHTLPVAAGAGVGAAAATTVPSASLLGSEMFEPARRVSGPFATLTEQQRVWLEAVLAKRCESDGALDGDSPEKGPRAARGTNQKPSLLPKSSELLSAPTAYTSISTFPYTSISTFLSELHGCRRQQPARLSVVGEELRRSKNDRERRTPRRHQLAFEEPHPSSSSVIAAAANPPRT
ncbi:hypothetical protein VOLCADRAFT_103495 [Volvox carteri f. nagariensis]|uniref:Uncharacterized protein n=1 Tax=Volvox carteri f. nagariensis TaxID=3068 RepID=D8TM97_VOLCA|nr:uncharacterized protein VOLCADRAFT_103495 [Volvox carteri f. nagariensis]EFJ51466.1 hypothetical protein VOLCADRAFT_103495 [Volvox carteri f. nagariensis]|eukprot:XP_002947418.1 hypothetical protein VOLCADRAFT_103495 [Volvox carteri f. nagariensis]